MRTHNFPAEQSCSVFCLILVLSNAIDFSSSSCRGFCGYADATTFGPGYVVLKRLLNSRTVLIFAVFFKELQNSRAAQAFAAFVKWLWNSRAALAFRAFMKWLWGFRAVRICSAVLLIVLSPTAIFIPVFGAWMACIPGFIILLREFNFLRFLLVKLFRKFPYSRRVVSRFRRWVHKKTGIKITFRKHAKNSRMGHVRGSRKI
ncbi:MAG: hypothetical protein A3A28_04995 [Candidatus Sungbacteria bacterium RIFCSPLOWO2_01_FULL_47_32]|uniref:Uncharacterized protein n=1 Tax=Candidatus Sungbacteria bacterium RIFCSPHIGHO2_01_FULL_47_32 TaxID=1802264 RepID=A0A1G2K887_9BACT|nr:MAG: hypothetical protein UX72_C0011G0004 [Parcubacteria group bacterium GW2011_GWA2_47_10]OGZ94638.1 MAG: hypothetical protein A2633_01310 [Candidatus Sungbacteria bacterium RIFCSPHIGHO2_01_FULL_47_32]OGZ99513.1 MAG: hypothetical protein A3D57_00640 [Candidatus Sungbacteria bacterium RIFCSPHIGHO2_02_FULL_46_12]OHA04832.1 MAG: hypothetical protein A3A28_04995 [Candidatus Sungbacteria bacterium RIFCSPLOWO2_01_FULL_47_32]